MPHTDGTTDPDRFGSGLRRAPPASIFQQPNFLGCLEPAPELAAAADGGPGRLPIAHVDLMTLGVLEAPGELRVRAGDRRGPVGRQPHLLRRPPLRLPGRPRRTTSASCPAGSSARRATATAAAASCSRCRPASSTSAARRPPRTSPRTRRCWRWPAWCTCRWLGPDGAARGRRAPATSLAEHAKRRLGLPPAFDRPTSSGVRRAHSAGRRRGDRASARKLGVHPGYALGRDYPGMDDVLLVCLDRAAHARPTSTGWPRCCATVGVAVAA